MNNVFGIPLKDTAHLLFSWYKSETNETVALRWIEIEENTLCPKRRVGRVDSPPEALAPTLACDFLFESYSVVLCCRVLTCDGGRETQIRNEPATTQHILLGRGTASQLAREGGVLGRPETLSRARIGQAAQGECTGGVHIPSTVPSIRRVHWHGPPPGMDHLKQEETWMLGPLTCTKISSKVLILFVSYYCTVYI